MESFLAAVNARDDHVLRRLHPCRAIVLVGEYAGREGTVDPDRADHEPALIHVDGGGEYDARTAGYKFGSHGSDWVSLDGYGDDEDYQLVHVSALSFDNPHALAFALDRPIRWLVRSASGYECVDFTLDAVLWDECVPLLVALCARGRVACVELMLRRGAKVTEPPRQWSDWQPLHAAVSGEYHEGDGFILAGIDTCCEDDDAYAPDTFWTDRHKSTSVARARCVALLLEHNADVDARTCGATPLMMAAALGRYRCVQSLLAANADVNAEDDVHQGEHGEHGQTALHHCANYFGSVHRGHLEVAKLLLEADADVNLRAFEPNEGDRWGVLSLALRSRRAVDHTSPLELAELLCTYGAQPGRADDDLELCMMLGGLGGRRANQEWNRLRRGWFYGVSHFTSPLHFLEALSASRTRKLLRSGADVWAISALNETVLDDGTVLPHVTPASRARALLSGDAASNSRTIVAGPEVRIDPAAENECSMWASLADMIRDGLGFVEKTENFCRKITSGHSGYHQKEITRKVYAGELSFRVAIEDFELASVTITVRQLVLTETQQRVLQWDEVFVVIDLPREDEDEGELPPSWSRVQTPRLPRIDTLDPACYISTSR